MSLPSAILFSCTMNSIRSPMAAAIMRHFHGHDVYVDSVGVRTKEVDGFAVAVMEEIGIDISKHHPKTFEELEDSFFDLVVSLSPEAQHKAVDLTRYMDCEVVFWHTFDPSVVEGSRDERLEAYRRVRDELVSKIKENFPLRTAKDI
ncbi:arsenate reductase ArsC [Magnetovibrio sp. PR-2]|uniref:arsenate reductase ArsC n=1 Tax=Magnetovibrio sp. PR-2 TaxID=3120356 RepID=UPI002FCDFEB3